MDFYFYALGALMVTFLRLVGDAGNWLAYGLVVLIGMAFYVAGLHRIKRREEGLERSAWEQGVSFGRRYAK